MREENIKVKVTIPIPFGKPDKNGVMYTEEAVSNAVNNLHKNLPIIYRDNDKEIDGWSLELLRVHHILQHGILKIKFAR